MPVAATRSASLQVESHFDSLFYTYTHALTAAFTHALTLTHTFMQTFMHPVILTYPSTLQIHTNIPIRTN